MPCTVIAGAFWGDEGKGKIISYLALKDKLDVCVRTGSVNAAHTVWYKGNRYALHMVPAAFVYEKCRLLIGAGSNVEVKQLLEEIEQTGTKNRIGVDAQASIIEEKHSMQDKASAHLKQVVGTTGRGVGPAIEERVRRTAKLARDIPELKPYLTDVSKEANEAIDKGKNVMLEGTQGLLLSLYHGTYPYVTGRDTSAAAICSEAGVGPTKIDEVLIVFKSFMTRVGAGPLPGEITKEEAIKRGWFETAAGTGRDRRSAPFNFELAKKAVMLNSATQAAVTKLDVLFPTCKGAKTYDDLPKDAKQFIKEIEKSTGIPVVLIGTGPEALDIIDRRK
ncbi:MAG: adenylosuccinate synthetase [Candidatus Bathyarchaeota archaeon]|jgi:adenylosuccinate synthase|nr:adenylosuccinate synthetase [Candidatus Bathyarchaeota archaeon A05DMB-5]MDH7558529.1 adenylosuccinate synthetase [Candidatus Bathyarchaeota archaeon]